MDRIKDAFEKVERQNFVPASLKSQAQIDYPLPIGFSQTISQPTTVRLMMNWLQPEPGDKILDVGSGSGWTTALLADIVGPTGRIYAVERIPELVKFGRANVKRLGYKNAKFFQAKKRYGLAQSAPYERILVSAAAQELPKELLEQLKVGGKMVVPVKNDILEISRLSKSDYRIVAHPGFVFVPLV